MEAAQATREIGLIEALRLEEIEAYARRATGEKYLINPQKDSMGPGHSRSMRT